MSRLFNYFFKGVVLLAPLAFTVYVCVRVFATIDGWLGIPIPGVGFLASSFLTRQVLGMVEGMLERLPFVRLLYSSTKDLLNAFVGEKRRFDKPVLVSPFAGGEARVLGFVTQETLTTIGMTEHVAVYMPQSYNFAGQLMIFPASAVTPLDAESADVMAFIVSGGVTVPPVRRDLRTPPGVTTPRSIAGAP